jgi:hypothetical protein
MNQPDAVEIPLPAADSLPGDGLGILLITQTQTNWCWAACAQMVCGFYRPTVPVTQCQIVTAALGPACGCCAAPSSGPCNVTQATDQISALWNLLSITGSFEGNAASPQDVAASIHAGRPIECGVNWTGGGGHVILVTGANVDSSGTLWLYVLDPAGTSGWIDYAHVVSAGGMGAWICTWYNLTSTASAMTSTFSLTDSQRSSLATALGARIGQLPGLALRRHTSLGLGVALPRYFLGTNQLAGGAERLDAVAVDLGGLHHQIHGDDAPVACAMTSTPTVEGEALQVFGITEGTLAADVAEGLAFFDTHAHRSGEMRLLAVPALHVQILWLKGADGDDCLVVRAPEGSPIPRNQLLSARELLTALAALPPNEASFSPRGLAS